MHLQNLLVLSGKDYTLNTQSLYIKNGLFQSEFDSEERIDLKGYVAMPGFFNAAVEGKIEHLKSQLEAGCTTFIKLEGDANGYSNGTLKSIGNVVEFTHNPSTNSYSNGNLSIQKIHDFQYKSGDTTIGPLHCKFFGSGNSFNYSASIWTFIASLVYRYQDSDLEAHLVDVLKSVTVEPAQYFGVDGGVIEVGHPADFILFKVQDGWDVSSTPKLLKSIFLHMGHSQKAAAVFVRGQLAHALTEVQDIIQSVTLQKYYSSVNIPQVVNKQSEFDSIESAIEAIRNGEFIVAVDNEDRENEGDLIIAAEHLTPEKAAFMIRYTGGVLCAPAPGEIFDKLGIPIMVENNTDSLKTAYTVSIDAKVGTTTGISAKDRSTTINLLSSPNVKKGDFNMPGHVFPLRAVSGGVLQRVGHTEASVDLCKLAGLRPVAAISEVVLDDGRMARRDDLVVFCKKWGLKLITIDDLVQYRLRNEL